MKCSACYAENALWAQVCVLCGQPVVPIELCPNGHILPPGSRECAICPSTWPEAPAFSGPALLRGVLLVERGHLVDGRGGSNLPYLELRDSALPLTFAQNGPDRVERVASDGSAGDVRLLVRPEGIQICRKGGGPKGKMAYEVVSPAEKVAVGGVLLRPIYFEVPKRAGT
jgi:hypothetical protein